MKLTTNKEHKQGSFKKNKKNIYQKMDSIVILIALFSGILTTSVEYKLNSEKVIKISEDARNSIYSENIGFNSNPYEEFSHLKFSEPEIYMEDKNITEESLESIETLTLDMEKNMDLSFLNQCSNLKLLTLKNCTYLTNEHLKILNNIKSEKIVLNLNLKDIVKFHSNKNLDFTNLEKTVLVSFERTIFNNLQELESQLIYMLDSKLPDNYLLNYIEYPKHHELDTRIDELISQIDLSNCITEEDKVLKIIGFLIDYINYDEEVINYFYENEILEKGTYIYEKCLNYNNYTLSSVLSDQEEVEAICCNYASVFSVICNKLGIENHYISGKLSVNLNRHAWNLVKIDGKYKLIDLTNMDTLDINNYYDALDLMDEKSRLEVIEILKKELLTIVNDESLKYYLSDNNIDNLMKETVNLSEITYYNENIEGKIVNNKGINYALPLSIMIGELVMYVFVDIKKEKKKRDNDANKLK